MDFLSNLPECLLISIISLLPIKDCVRTSVLSKSWRNLCRETTNLVFKESEFVNLSVYNEKTIETIKRERVLFVYIMCEWISGYTGKSMESFELYISELEEIETNIMSLIEFATSKQVKNLVLDFSYPVSRRVGVAEIVHTMNYYQNNVLDLSHLVFNLLYVRNLTICSFIVQMIQDCDDPMEVHGPLKTQHLVMKINMHVNEFEGISIFLNCCPELESLTFDLVPTELIVRTCLPFDPTKYWLTNKAYECLEKTLKVVKVKNFRGGENELCVLRYLIRAGIMMERLDIHEANGLNDKERNLVLAGAQEIQSKFNRGSSHLQINLHNA